jgi:hypothetical protein
MVRRILNFFGSLKLAVTLLSTIAVVLTVTTFYESGSGTRSATVHVYQSWWFNYVLLGLLAVNVAAAALTRWPWKRRHVGFVITHTGIIVMLAGCGAAFHYGTEGMMNLRVGNPPTSTVRIFEGGEPSEAISVVVPETNTRLTTPIRLLREGRVTPSRINLPGGLTLSLHHYIPNTKWKLVVEDGAAQFNPALRFRLRSELTQVDVAEWLLATAPGQDSLSVGPARVEFVVAGDEAELARLTTPPAEDAAAHPDIEIALEGQRFTFPIQPNLGKQLALGQTGASAQLMDYWPDFQLDEKTHQPATVSEEPNNPAALVIVSRAGNEDRAFVFSHPHMPPIVRTVSGRPVGAQVRLVGGQTASRASVMTVIIGPDGQLHYAARSRHDFKSGRLELGETIRPGWMDFTFTAERYVERAKLSHTLEPAPEDPTGGFPAVVLTVQGAGRSEPATLRFGEPEVAEINGQTLHMVYGWETMQLPFTVQLQDFIVERDEGSDNVAGWTSKVVFRDATRGLTLERDVWMNNPAWFQGYKFSQASWDPNDLKFSALQVKKDPRFVTWLTWVGAILIISGITIMFYFRGWLNAKPPTDARPAPAAADAPRRQRATTEEPVSV